MERGMLFFSPNFKVLGMADNNLLLFSNIW
jgi:hypothetical protein